MQEHRGTNYRCGRVYKYSHISDRSISPHHGHNVTAPANVNIARAFGVEVEPNQVCARLHGREGIGHSFDPADFDFGHDFSLTLTLSRWETGLVRH